MEMPLSRFAKISFVLLCVLSFVLMTVASFGDSVTSDEVAHIPAGYGYVRHLDYRLNPEHPPLLKALSAIPLALLPFTFDTAHKAWTTMVNGQWDMGGNFLYDSGNDATAITRYARLFPILFTLFTLWFVYKWSRELLGPVWGLVPALLFGLSPTVLAHGHYVTTDVASAAGIMVTTYYFLKYLRAPSKKTFFIASCAFGFAQLTKFSAFLLIPYLGFLAVLYAIVQYARNHREGFFSETKELIGRFIGLGLKSVAIMALGYALIVYPTYALFTANYPAEKQQSDTEFLLKSFGGGPTPDGQPCRIIRCPADLGIWLAAQPVARPFAYYFLGVLMVIQRSAGGNTNYFLGNVTNAGSHLYFPLMYLLKEPVPVLILVLGALVHCFKRWRRREQAVRQRGAVADYIDANFTEIAMGIFIALYWLNSITSPLNIGLRHLMPTLPFIYLLTATEWKRIVLTFEAIPSFSALSLVRQWLKAAVRSSLWLGVLVLLLAWFILETLVATPYYLAYYNEIGGGTSQGYRHATDSNYDWGQDLLRLKTWVDANPQVEKIAVDYWGNAKYYLGEKEENWWSARGNPADQGIHYLAIGANTLQGNIQPTKDDFQRKPEDEYRWLLEARGFWPHNCKPHGDLQCSLLPRGEVPPPDYRVGTSIFIYKL